MSLLLLKPQAISSPFGGIWHMIQGSLFLWVRPLRGVFERGRSWSEQIHPIQMKACVQTCSAHRGTEIGSFCHWLSPVTIYSATVPCSLRSPWAPLLVLEEESWGPQRLRGFS